MSSPYLSVDQIKPGTLLRSRKDGSLTLVLGDPGVPHGLGWTGWVEAYDFKRGQRIQLHVGYIHAEIVGGRV